LIDFPEGFEFLGGIVTGITYEFADILAVLLFHEGVVVLVVGSRAGKLDLFAYAPVMDLSVQELRAIVGIDGDEAERQCVLDVDERLFDPALGTIEQGSQLNPPGHGIGGVEGAAELIMDRHTAVEHRIDFQVSRALFI